ncbi:hypothetical protein GCK72_015037 [Caenorhabditis remanei]|uniref:Uncharacterized protein n=2 Tax=Caenorhabditis remanei TaxID=31234 RepID=A0A6A5GSX6_CAERE|nr:hypothetical protein GCK72_015037 [Caenorhabditis remanei]KAF1758578.1 hypothetical protein GCK72_015037 [Caenorhabditis remanei]
MSERESDGPLTSLGSVSTARTSRKEIHANNIVPFNASLYTILTIIGTLQISVIIPSIGSFVSFISALFLFEWLNLHFQSMTRSRRACFDVANVLETYQPRNRTHGHLFVPDPPTPCVKIDEDGSHDMPKEKNAFSNARDSHYENMYQKAIQMAKEMDQMEKIAASPNLDASQNVELKPANPEQDKKESEEKAKQAKKKYDDDMSKPFSC